MVADTSSLTLPPFVEQLFVSIESLRAAVTKARENLSFVADDLVDKDSILNHFSDYEEILNKQEKFAHELITELKNNNLEGIHRYCRLINGMSVMIRDDAKEIAKFLNNSELEVNNDVM